MGFNIIKMVETINKENIASEIAEQFGISKSQSAEMVGDIIDVMTDIIFEEGKVRIPYFGTFILRDKNARVGRNPKTKQEFDIPARTLVTFKASDSFKDFVNDN
jgi:integration host factor subunit alpha